MANIKQSAATSNTSAITTSNTSTQQAISNAATSNTSAITTSNTANTAIYTNNKGALGTSYTSHSHVIGSGTGYKFGSTGPCKGEIRLDNSTGSMLVYDGNTWVCVAGLEKEDNLVKIKKELVENFPEAAFDLMLKGLL